jgi:transposase
MEAYSMDLRTRVLAACDGGQQTKQVAKLFSVSPAWVRRLKQRRRDDGSIAPRAVRRTGNLKLDESARVRVLDWIQQKPDSTLEELRGRIDQELNVRISIGALWETLRRMKLSFKKSRRTQPSSRVRTWQSSVPAGMSS